MSIRQQLVDAIEARFGAILIGGSVMVNGSSHDYQTDIGAKVLPWQVTGLQPEQCPCLVFADRDGESTLDEADLSQQQHILEIAAAGVFTGTDAVEQARLALADILAAIGSDPYWSGIGDATTLLLGHDIEAEQQSHLVASGTVRFAIHYYSELWNI